MALSPETQALLNQWAALCDTDTAGTAAPALTAGSDSNGVGYNVGDLVITFPDGTRACIPAKTTAGGDDTFGAVAPAPADGVDSMGTPFVAGNALITFPDGSTVCVPPKIEFVDTDTFASVAPAGVDGVDSAGVPYLATDTLITFADGSTLCVTKTPDTYATIEAAPADGTDSFGNTFLASDPVITLPDGQTICVPTKQEAAGDTFATAATATADGTDAFGNIYTIGDTLVTMPNNDVVCIPPKLVDTDTFSSMAPAPADGVDTAGNTYLATDTLITFANGDTLAIASATDTFATIAPAPAAGTDSFGNNYLIDAALLTLPDGQTVCIPPKVEAGVDTFATSAAAVNAGSDAYGNGFNVGDIIITMPNGDLICLPPKVTFTDTFGTAATAPADGVDSFGNNYLAGSTIITFADGSTLCTSKDTNDGYAEQAVSDASTVDAEGVAIPAGEPVINFYDSTGTYLNSFLKSGPDGYAEQSLADAATVDQTGAAIPAGTEVINFYDADGVYVNSCAKATPAEQELFKAGDTLPADMVGTVDVRLADGTFVTLGAGDPIPADAGDVFVDEVTGEATCIVKSLSDPEVDLLKYTDDQFAIVGDVVTYTYCVLNSGDVDLTTIAIDDDVMGVIDTSSAALPLAPGAKTTVTAPYTVTQADVDAGSIRNVATVTGADINGNSASAMDDEVVVGIVPPCISLVKLGDVTTITAPPTGTSIQPINYTFEVTNCGEEDIVNAIVTDPLVAVVGGPIPLLAAGATDTTTFTATYTPTQADIDAGSVTNVAQVDGAGVDTGLPVSDTDDHVVTIEACTGTTLVCGQLPRSGRITMDAVIDSPTQATWTDPVTGAITVMTLSGLPSAGVGIRDVSGGTAIRLENTSDTDAGTYDISFTHTPSTKTTAQGWKFVTDWRQLIGDYDEVTVDGVADQSCVSGFAPAVLTGSAPWTETPAGSGVFCITPGTGDGSNGQVLFDDVDTQAPVTWGYTVDVHAPLDLVAILSYIRYVEPVDAEVDCDGNIVSAVDCNGDPVADLTTITLV